MNIKTSFLFFGTLLTLNCFSQKSNGGIILTKGMQVIVKTNSTQDADMGMGMEMKNFTSMQNRLVILGADDTSYTLTNTLTGIKLSMDFMGQSTNFDSDKKEDSSTEIGKSLKNLNIPDTAILNKFNSSVTLISQHENDPAEETNPMAGLFQKMSKPDQNVIAEAFFIIPKGKKAGDKWNDSTITKDNKTYRSYFIKSMENGIATIILEKSEETNSQVEMQGMQVAVTMSTKSESEIKADAKSSQVRKRDTKTEIKGNLEMMGQSLPVTGNTSTSSVYDY